MIICSMQGTIKVIFLAVLCLINFAYADSPEYRLIIEHYGLNQDDVLGYSEGNIDGEYYLALNAIRLFPKEENKPNVYLLTIRKGEPSLVVKMDLQLNDSFGFSLNIMNNSLYVLQSVAHHGWHDIRFQFKRVSQEFKLVGIEQQSMVLGCYAGDESLPSCDKYEVWSGNSYNLMTSNTICWKENLFFIHKSNTATDRYKKWLQPKKGIRHQMKFSQIKLPLLDGFNFYEFTSPKSCYFDSKNKLIK